MGLEVAKALHQRGGWNIHLLDLRPPTDNIEDATFHKVNVMDYDSLATAFQNILDSDGRLDFVFANAGIVERFNFYEEHPLGKAPPPPPDLTVVDINLKSVIHTSWLAQHYFRQSTQSENKNLVMTASVGALYRCQVSPSYCAAKHGVLGLMRSIAPGFYSQGIRVNAICPGTVKTNLLGAAAWATFSDDVFVPIDKISETVLMLIDGYDSKGKQPNGTANAANGVGGYSVNGSGAGEKLWGKAVELSGRNHYYRTQPAYCDDHMAKCMRATDRQTYNEK
jgi:NAD(P)-dependent dehydrogenase (short-subunit alcohol dehydrogenase family)